MIVSEPKPGADWVLRVSAVLFDDGPAAADGDPGEIEWMRYHRLGEMLEFDRCTAALAAMDPPRRGDVAIARVLRSTEQAVRPLEVALASLPDSALKENMIEASAGATEAFLVGVDFARQDCRTSLEELKKQMSLPPGSAGPNNPGSIPDWVTLRQANAKSYREQCEVDMGLAR